MRPRARAARENLSRRALASWRPRPQSSSRPDASHAAPMMSALIAGVAAPLRTPRAAAPAPRAPRRPRARRLDDASDRERPAPSGARSSRRSFFSAAFAATLSGASDPALGQSTPRARPALRALASPPFPSPAPFPPHRARRPREVRRNDANVYPRPLFLRRAGAFLVGRPGLPPRSSPTRRRVRVRVRVRDLRSAAFEIAGCASPGYRNGASAASTSLWRRARDAAGATTRSPPRRVRGRLQRRATTGRCATITAARTRGTSARLRRVVLTTPSHGDADAATRNSGVLQDVLQKLKIRCPGCRAGSAGRGRGVPQHDRFPGAWICRSSASSRRTSTG